MRGVLVAILSGLLSAGCSVFGVRTEAQPAYTVERQIGPVEIRRYGGRVAAETTVAGSESEARNIGFRRLAGYIFGGNHAKQSIAMTAPVDQSAASQTIPMTAPVGQDRVAPNEWRIRFYMPANETLTSLPVPNDPAVRLVAVPAENIAVLRYSGSIGAAAVHAAEGRLMAAVAAAGLGAEGAPFTWFYDPPWTLPPLRRNEAAVKLGSG